MPKAKHLRIPFPRMKHGLGSPAYAQGPSTSASPANAQGSRMSASPAVLECARTSLEFHPEAYTISDLVSSKVQIEESGVAPQPNKFKISEYHLLFPEGVIVYQTTK